MPSIRPSSKSATTRLTNTSGSPSLSVPSPVPKVLLIQPSAAILMSVFSRMRGNLWFLEVFYSDYETTLFLLLSAFEIYITGEPWGI